MERDRKSTSENKIFMLECLGKSLGIVSTAAKKAGISRETHRLWMRDDPEYAAKVAEVREDRVDFIESMAHKRVSEGSDTMIIFMLKTQGKERGYIERQDVNITTTLNEDERKARIAELKNKLDAAD